MLSKQLPQNKHLILSVIVVGNSGVGKTNLLYQYCYQDFQENLKSTIGVDFYTKIIKKNDLVLNLKLFDSAGQERFRAINTSYYRNCDAVILVYDITARESFDAIPTYVSAIADKKQNVPILLIANKLDLESERKISKEEGKVLSIELGCLFLSCP